MSEMTDRRRRRPRLGVEGQRSRLREAALAVFPERGVENTSVEDVLRTADVSRQTFYRCYADKDELFHDVHRSVTARLLAALAPATGDDEGAPTFESLAARFFGLARALGPIVVELEREAMRSGSPFEVHRVARRELGVDFLERWLADAHDANVSRPLLVGLSIAFGQLFLDVAAAPSDEDVLKTTTTTARALIEAALHTTR